VNGAQWSSLSNTVEQFAAAAGILGGGVWAYFKFLRGRAFAYRAQLTIDELASHPGPLPSISLQVNLANSGLSKVPFAPGLKVVKVFAVTDRDWFEDRNINWGEPFILTPIFENHGWLEAGETITEAVLVPVAAEMSRLCVAYRVTADVFAAPRREKGPNVSWFAETLLVVNRDTGANQSESNTDS
jgi:hypothetical protein